MLPDLAAPHLDAPLLLALAQNQVEAELRTTAERHLAGCPACRSALGGMVGPAGVLDTVGPAVASGNQTPATTPTEMVAQVSPGTPRPWPSPSAASGLGALPFLVDGLLAGKFRPLRVIGAGGMGVVIAADHVQLHQRVALKFMQPEMVGQAEATERFLREARAAASLRSEHVCRVIDLGQLEGGVPYMVMEFLEGESLESLLARSGTLPAHLAAAYLVDALEAIGEAHAKGIVHRDLKPGNLWLTARADGPPRVKVLDFGISKAVRSPSALQITSAHALLGTPVYMAPEQLVAPSTVDGRTDLWAVGCILFQLTTGTLPFDGKTFDELATRIRSTDARPVRSLRPELPAAFEAVIAQCLQRDPSRRPQTAAELASALAGLRTPVPGPVSLPAHEAKPAGRPPSTLPLAGRRRTAVWVAAALGVVVGGGLGGLGAARWLNAASASHLPPTPAPVAAAPAPPAPAPVAVPAAPPPAAPSQALAPGPKAAPVAPAAKPEAEAPVAAAPPARPALSAPTPAKHPHRTQPPAADSARGYDDVFGKR